MPVHYTNMSTSFGTLPLASDYDCWRLNRNLETSLRAYIRYKNTARVHPPRLLR